MLTGSAAQPRSGTAPKAPAASAVFRNLRRLVRFESILPATTDCWASRFMPSSPVRSGDAVRFVIGGGDPSAFENCLQYSFQYYHSAIGGLPPGASIVPGGATGQQWAQSCSSR